MKKLLVGLDIGTNSVGWCACDENGKIVKKNGKRLWGARLFDEASDAKSRRLYRGARRRLQRRKERMSLLKSLFDDEIEKTDSSFFYRLENSFFRNDDREHKFEYTLFNDRNFSDKEYYKKFPTIYHLRDYLCNSKQKEDIRFIYLAVAHIIKFRGNFLSDKDNFEVSDLNEIKEQFKNLNDALLDEIDENVQGNEFFAKFDISDSKIEELRNFSEQAHTLTDTKKKYEELLMLPNSKQKFNKDIIIPLMAGSVIQTKNLLKFCDIDEEEIEIKKICVKSEDFIDNIHALNSQGIISDNVLKAFECVVKINDFFTCVKLLGKYSTISKSFKTRYERHKRQLKELKTYVKNNLKNDYYEIFRKSAGSDCANYPHYIGSNNTKGITQRFAHSANKEDFYKFLKSKLGLKDVKKEEDIQDDFLKSVWLSMQRGEYLERINSAENGVFPYQLHKVELEKILENQSEYYPFLNEVSDGLSVKEKILSLLQYRVPYYVGPLNKSSKFAWVVRKTEEKITPWNFDKVIDKQQTQIEFIRRAASKCTYVYEENCLAKNSLVFCLFNTYNQINKIKINNQPITVEQKEDIISNLFMNERKVSKKRLKEYLKSKYINCDIALSGKGALGFEEGYEINFNLAPFVDFKKIFGEEFYKDDKLFEKAERIIEAVTIFEDKKNLEEYLRYEFKELSNEQIKTIKALDYKKWATISKKLLTSFKTHVSNDKTGGEDFQKSILDLLKEENQNFMEIIYDSRYDFLKQIEEYNRKQFIKDVGHSDNYAFDIKKYVDSLSFVSPLIKRPIIQAYKICDEIEKITKHRIDEYYIECARTNKAKNKKKMQKSRKRILEDLYKSITEFDNKSKSTYKELEKIEEQKIRRDKIYLYFLQLGRDMYTGESIEFNDIEAYYDIDHIVPQSYTKDDSVDNRVLVRKNINNLKGDKYPLSDWKIIWQNNGGWKKAYEFWKYLHKNNLISNAKFINLTRIELTNEDLEGFVNRQLTTTNQAVKVFTKVIKESKSTYDFEPKIIYSKAENVSDYRKLSIDESNRKDRYLGIGKNNEKLYEVDILKNRTVNNFHHAHDAYLNIIVGRTTDVYFENLRLKYGKDFHERAHQNKLTTNVNKIFEQNGYKEDIKDRDGNLVYSYDNTLREVQKNIRECFDIFVTERCFVKNELFGKVTINPAKGKNNSIPIKESIEALKNTKGYGGLSEYGFHHYSLLEVITEKGKTEYILEPIPYRFKDEMENYLHFENYKIIRHVININTLFEKKFKVGEKLLSSSFVITGKTNDSYFIKNRNERIFPYDLIRIIRKIEKINNSRINSDNVDLSDDEIKQIYEYFIQLLDKPIYSALSNQCSSISNLLKEKRQLFDDLPPIDKEKGNDKCKLIMNLLDFLKCNERKTIDLSLISDKKNAGTLTINKKLKDCDIVFESITGFYKKVIFSC